MQEQRRFHVLMFILTTVLTLAIAGYALSACGSSSTTTGKSGNIVAAPGGGAAIAPQATVQTQAKTSPPALAPTTAAKPAATTAANPPATTMPAMPNMPGMASPAAQAAQGAPAAAPAATATAPRSPYDAKLPPLLPLATGTTDTRVLEIVTTDTLVEIAPGVKLAAWPYNGTIPGPVVHVKQGDTVHFVLTNRGTMPHSIDFHAAQVPPNKYYVDVAPNNSMAFDWKADYPGVFMYHCGSPLVIAHMANGMYGAVVVDPPTPLPPAREYVLVQSEFYLTGTEGNVQVDPAKAIADTPDFMAFNGYVNQYKDVPLEAKAGERVRFYVVNAGPNEFSAFHVIGTIFENAYADGNLANAQHGMQTVTIPPGGAYMVEFTIPNPGTYAFVSHSFHAVNMGAVGVLKVTP
jgi:nitrite reductase (NO-forming)